MLKCSAMKPFNQLSEAWYVPLNILDHFIKHQAHIHNAIKAMLQTANEVATDTREKLAEQTGINGERKAMCDADAMDSDGLVLCMMVNVNVQQML